MHLYPRSEGRGQKCIEMFKVRRGILLDILPISHKINVLLPKRTLNQQCFAISCQLNWFVRLDRGEWLSTKI